MKKRKVKNVANESGFSLIEMLCVLFIISIISAIAVSRIYTGSNEVGGGERVLDEATARLTERRADAVRLNGDDRRSNLLQFQAAPLPIDFSDLTTTASLRTDGTDEDKDCVDDFTGKKMTCLQIGGNRGEWILQLNEDALRLPDGWQVYVGGRGSLVPPIGDGRNGRGVPATAIGFDATGKAMAKEVGYDEWVKMPTGSVASENPSANEVPFWAIYFLVPGSSRGSVKAAVAVAVHPSGLIEKFRYDDKDGAWIGFKNRVVK